jgi:glycolate oxidase FAD binding subunit
MAIAESDLLGSLGASLGPDGVGGDSPIPGQRPLAVCSPGSDKEACEAVRIAREQETPIYPCGLGLRQSWGNPPKSPGLVLKTGRLQEIANYSPEDLTITVQAGMSLLELFEATSVHGQWLPVAPAGLDRTTVGGLIAANVGGPLRFGYGPVRDYLLALRYVNCEGRIIKTGAEVVKNVAGLDLCKLMNGSFGTLGLIVDATFKLRPIPSSMRLAILSFEEYARAGETANAVIDGPTRPMLLELINPIAVAEVGLSGTGPVLVVGYHDTAVSTDWQVNQLVASLAGRDQGNVETLDESESMSLYERIRDWPIRRSPQLITFKASVPPSRVFSFTAEAMEKAGGFVLGLTAEAGDGIVWGRIDGAVVDDPGPARSVCDDLLRLAVEAGGNMIVTEIDPAIGESVLRWGRPFPSTAVMKRLKDTLDPAGVFSPGRFVAGI